MKLSRPYRILVIDDDEALHGVYSCMLEPAADSPALSRTPTTGITDQTPATNFPQFEIDFALQGQAGLERVRQASADGRPYAMAFVDMRMPPGWDGIQTISHIWKECFELQVVICTGFQDFSWHDLIKQFGHTDRLLIMKKPFDMTEVRQVAYSLAEKWDLAHESQSNLQRLQKLVSERTAKLQEANLSLQRKIIESTRAERRLVTQYSVNRALALATTLAGAVEIIFQIVCRSLDWDWAAFWQVDAKANVLRFTNHWHAPDASFDKFVALCKGMTLEPEAGLPGRVWSGGNPAWVQDISAVADCNWRAAAAENGMHGAIGIPIYVSGKVFAVMEFLSLSLREKDKHMLQTFAVISSAIGQFVEHKQADEDLKRERDYIEQIIRETPALVVGIAPDGRTTFANPSVARHTGYPEGELIGRNWWHLLYPGEEYHQVEQLFLDLKRGPVRDYEMVLTNKDGEKRTVSWNSLNKLDEAGRLAEIIGFGNDITERKQAERERGVMEVQLRHAQKMESIGQLAAGIAHEINTPTQYIGDNIRFLQTSFGELCELQTKSGGLFQAAKNHAVNPELLAEMEEVVLRTKPDFLLKEIPEALQQSLEGVERVARIVGAMRDFSHPGTGEKTHVDLNKTVETALTVAGNEWKYCATIANDLDHSLPPVPCLPGELNQVILNLVVNAAHSIADVVGNGGRGKGLITASTRLSGEWAEISIRDTGTGIPEKIRAKIFDPFFTTKPAGKGTGQGLSIAHSVIVDRHQGQLTFETEMGVGTVFTIRLPVKPAERENKEAHSG